MSWFSQSDIVPLWDRPPDFLPLRPQSGSHHWSYASVRAELDRVSSSLDKASSERRVALLAHPDLEDAAATDGLHAGIQLLLGGESADAHRHTPAALRIGLEATDMVTVVNDNEVPLGPLDVVLNPSGTWHGHVERGGDDAVWLDVVDLPLVSAIGAVMFEPTRAHQTATLLDPPSTPSSLCYPWATIEPQLSGQEAIDGVRGYAYGEGAVLPTMGVTVYAVDHGATINLARHSGGSIILAARGSFASDLGPVEACDVVSLRAWTEWSMTSQSHDGIVMVIDTVPALRALGLHREEPVQ